MNTQESTFWFCLGLVNGTLIALSAAHWIHP